MFDESAAEAWRLRYGVDAPKLPDLGRFLNHRSVRKFRPDPIPEETMAGLVAAAQSAATSSNLQLWSIVSVQDPDRRNAIAELCSNQNQVRQAAWFLAFLADVYRLEQAAAQVGIETAGTDTTEFLIMACVDAALAAERMVCAAESLGIGICYIGALRNDPAGVQKLLGLPAGTFGVFGLCLGWPEEPLTAAIKPRLAQSNVWHRERYETSVDVSDYDMRMRAFYESQQMKGEVTWSMRSGRRADGSKKSMGGREHLAGWLASQGMGRR